MKIALCCIVKNENDYLLEYCEYYHRLGTDKIFIYDNNDVDGEKPSDVIGHLDYVEIIDYRGRHKCQCQAYNDCAKEHQSEFEWMMFFDADEFIEFTNSWMTIKDYVNMEMFNKYDSISLSWCNYDDNGLLGNENNHDRNLFKRFTHHEECNHKLTLDIKQICRISKVLPSFSYPHYSKIKNNCNNKGKACGAKVEQDWTFAKINHYRKTIIEFIENKLNRGWADGNTLKLTFKWFYDYSKHSKEKTMIEEWYNEHHEINYDIKKEGV